MLGVNTRHYQMTHTLRPVQAPLRFEHGGDDVSQKQPRLMLIGMGPGTVASMT